MLTAIVEFRLPPGHSRETALADIEAQLPMYAAAPGLLSKAISLDLANGRGRSVYLWESREAAEPFFAMASRMIGEATGHAPEVTLMEVDAIVDTRLGLARMCATAA